MRNTPPVLLVEDDENDILLMEFAFEEVGLTHPLRVVRNGQEAIHYLSGQGRYAQREQYPSPCLVLLDLNLPLVDGFGVLEWLRQQPRAGRHLPVVILSSSAMASDLERARAFGALDYQVKPNSTAGLVRIVRELHARWLLPGAGPSSSAAVEP